jgi:DNA-binding MarR family transcriptional regulator
MNIAKWLNRDAKVTALAEAIGIDTADAERVLAALEAQGFTIYNKKRKLNDRRDVASQPMTPEMRRRIKELHETSSLTQQQIAASLNINIGRVCEALT